LLQKVLETIKRYLGQSSSGQRWNVKMNGKIGEFNMVAIGGRTGWVAARFGLLAKSGMTINLLQ
jgi:hypothetical protein